MTRDLAYLEIGDEVVGSAGEAWRIVDVFEDARFGLLVSFTVERDGQRVVLDADATEIWHDGDRWRCALPGETKLEAAMRGDL